MAFPRADIQLSFHQRCPDAGEKGLAIEKGGFSNAP